MLNECVFNVHQIELNKNNFFRNRFLSHLGFDLETIYYGYYPILLSYRSNLQTRRKYPMRALKKNIVNTVSRVCR